MQAVQFQTVLEIPRKHHTLFVLFLFLIAVCCKNLFLCVKMFCKFGDKLKHIKNMWAILKVVYTVWIEYKKNRAGGPQNPFFLFFLNFLKVFVFLFIYFYFFYIFLIFLNPKLKKNWAEFPLRGRPLLLGQDVLLEAITWSWVIEFHPQTMARLGSPQPLASQVAASIIFNSKVSKPLMYLKPSWLSRNPEPSDIINRP